MKTGIQLITEERERQINAEGWTPRHDDGHTWGELVSAAICYANAGDNLANSKRCVGDNDTPESLQREILNGDYGIGVSWPWGKEWLKISPEPIRNLAKAGALIAAEIDRLQRRAAAESANEKGQQ